MKFETLRLDFIRRGENQNINAEEIQLADPPYERISGKSNHSGGK